MCAKMTKKQMLSPRKKYDIKLRIYLKTHHTHTHTHTAKDDTNDDEI